MVNEQRVRTIFDEACELSGPEREAFLRQACGGDDELQARVLRLLEAAEKPDAFLASPTAEPNAIGAGGDARSAGERPGAVIDRYVLVERLGEGGFGSVWKAEQQHPVVRPVALKIIKLGMDTRQVIARFEAERQALALMDHPNIARVFDAGATETGRPFFVMELVGGEPITLWCNENSVSIRQRLELFEQVCQAVQHAHTKGVIHRDLKPSNVLVSLQDGQPRVKVIDFGIAKATSARLTEKTLLTEHRQLIGTPEYMSPEQAEGSVDIDTRTDVYSLGVILYELLVGQTPFDSRSLRVSAYAEIQRIIREVDPPWPSTRLSRAGDTLATLAVQRQTEPSKLPRLVRGDLDWIVMKALEKDRTRRYETASALAMDVERHLAGKEVLAAPPSTLYRMRKFIARNRASVTAAALVGVALVVGVVGTSVGLFHANRQRELAVDAREGEKDQRQRAQENERSAILEAQRAEREATRAKEAEEQARERARELEQVAEFQALMLQQIDPAEAGTALRGDIRSRSAAGLARMDLPESERLARLEALEAELANVNFTDAASAMIDRNVLKPAIAAIESQFADQPLVAASLQYTVASAYTGLARFEEAIALQQQSLDTCTEVLGPGHRYTLRCLNAIGYLLLETGRLQEAESRIREALATGESALGEDHEVTLTALNNLGALYQAQGKLPEAEAVHRDCLERNRRQYGEESGSTIRSMLNLAAVLRMRQTYAEAETLNRKALDLGQRHLGPGDSTTLTARANLGVLLHSQGRLAEAEAIQRENLAVFEGLYGEEHSRTLQAMYGLSTTLSDLEPAKAEEYSREVLERCHKALGEDHRLTGMALNNVAQSLRKQGKFQEAEPLLRRALDQQRRISGEEHLHTLSAIINLARVLEHLNRRAEVEALYREAYAKARAKLGPEHDVTFKATSGLAKCLLLRREYSEAEPLLRQSIATSGRLLGTDHPETLAMTLSLVDIVSRLRRPAEAEALCRDLLQRQRRVLGDDDPDTLRSLSNMTMFLQNRGELAEAEAYAAEAAEAYRNVHGAGHPLALVALDHLAQVMMLRHKFAEAEPLCREVYDGRLKAMGPDHQQTLMSLERLGKVLHEGGKPDEAEPYLRDAVARNILKFGEDHLSTAGAQLSLGRVLADLGRFADAEAALLASERAASLDRMGRQMQIDAIDALASLYERWHAADPGGGHDAKLAACQAQRDALAATTRPATRQASSPP